MEASQNQNTVPMHPRFDFDAFDKRIEGALTENERVLAWRIKDHELALQGTADAIAQLRQDQNG